MYIVAIITLLFMYTNYFIPMPDWLGYWDEAIGLICIFGGIIRFLVVKKGKIHLKRPCSTIVICTLLICFLGLLSNFLFSLQPSVNAIVRDVVGFIKFPIVFVVI